MKQFIDDYIEKSTQQQNSNDEPIFTDQDSNIEDDFNGY
jgi:hypothetical protein